MSLLAWLVLADTCAGFLESTAFWKAPEAALAEMAGWYPVLLAGCWWLVQMYVPGSVPDL